MTRPVAALFFLGSVASGIAELTGEAWMRLVAATGFAAAAFVAWTSS